jgi:hypothetical protein
VGLFGACAGDRQIGGFAGVCITRLRERRTPSIKIHRHKDDEVHDVDDVRWHESSCVLRHKDVGISTAAKD